MRLGKLKLLVIVALNKRMNGKSLTRQEQRVLSYMVDSGTHGQSIYDDAFKIRVGE